MSQPPPTRLRESEDQTPRGAKVIDARFEVIGSKRSTWIERIGSALVMLFWAAVIGFLIPPLWMLTQRLGEFLALG